MLAPALALVVVSAAVPAAGPVQLAQAPDEAPPDDGWERASPADDAAAPPPPQDPSDDDTPPAATAPEDPLESENPYDVPRQEGGDVAGDAPPAPGDRAANPPPTGERTPPPRDDGAPSPPGDGAPPPGDGAPPPGDGAPAPPAQGMDDPTSGLVMYAAGLGVTTFLSAPLAVIGCCTLGIGPSFVVGLVVAWVGDAMSQKRGNILWPSLAFLGAGVAAGLAAGVVGFGGSAALGAIGLGQLAGVPGTVAGAAAFLAAMAAPVVVYFLTAEPKRPGDSGGGFPGFVDPAHPPPPGTVSVDAALPARPVLSARRAPGAMAF